MAEPNNYGTKSMQLSRIKSEPTANLDNSSYGVCEKLIVNFLPRKLKTMDTTDYLHTAYHSLFHCHIVESCSL